MKICYIISSYKLPEQVVRLVRRLGYPGIYFYIHIDKRSDDSVFYKIRDSLSSLNNVFLLTRDPSYYGSYGHVKTTLKGINAALKSEFEFDYMVLLTGQDYPIKSTVYIKDFLQQNYGKSFLSYYTLEDQYAGKWHERLGKFYTFNEKGSHASFGGNLLRPIAFRLWGISKNRQNHYLAFPDGMVPYFGNAYWVIHRKHIEYIHEFVRRKPGFVNFYKRSRVPDEVFFHSILLNSIYRDEIVNNDLFYIDWSDKKSSPSILTTKDFQRLINVEDLFARKFDINVDSTILDLLDNHIS